MIQWESMGINEWRKTVKEVLAKDCEAIGVYGCDPDDKVLVYAGDVYINTDEEGGYYLIIGNCQYSDILPKLEKILFRYVVSEGLLENVNAIP